MREPRAAHSLRLRPVWNSLTQPSPLRLRHAKNILSSSCQKKSPFRPPSLILPLCMTKPAAAAATSQTFPGRPAACRKQEQAHRRASTHRAASLGPTGSVRGEHRPPARPRAQRSLQVQMKEPMERPCSRVGWEAKRGSPEDRAADRAAGRGAGRQGWGNV